MRSSLGNLRDGLMRSIHRLAAELYSGNVHFVLELVQNADDNAYAPGVLPTLRIVARREQIVFENNEVGFAERNVLAICSMGESTKQASDAGYIGNKGIGFKSVFKLTTTPRCTRATTTSASTRPTAAGSATSCPSPSPRRPAGTPRTARPG